LRRVAVFELEALVGELPARGVARLADQAWTAVASVLLRTGWYVTSRSCARG
jgi:hypothetical protein